MAVLSDWEMQAKALPSNAAWRSFPQLLSSALARDNLLSPSTCKEVLSCLLAWAPASRPVCLLHSACAWACLQLVRWAVVPVFAQRQLLCTISAQQGIVQGQGSQAHMPAEHVPLQPDVPCTSGFTRTCSLLLYPAGNCRGPMGALTRAVWPACQCQLVCTRWSCRPCLRL